MDHRPNKYQIRWLVLLFVLPVFVACGQPAKDIQVDDSKSLEKRFGTMLDVPNAPGKIGADVDSIPLGLAKLPESLLAKVTVERVELGKKLFFDPGLSRDGTIACATCHRPENGFASLQKLAVGIDGKMGTRNSPSLFNRAYGKSFFWDGRAATLEEQSLQPIESETELGNTLSAVMAYLKSDSDYQRRFEAAFGSKDSIQKENLAIALACFQLTLLKGDSRVDRFQAGQGADQLTDVEKHGLWLFEGKGGCWKCHSGANYSDEKFHDTGIKADASHVDYGRFDATRNEADRFRFKTPTLRGVAKTGPFMHNGSINTLREVVEFYDRGGDRRHEGISEKIRPLNLSKEEIDALVAFLKALSE